jgi:hypothetical protein
MVYVVEELGNSAWAVVYVVGALAVYFLRRFFSISRPFDFTTWSMCLRLVVGRLLAGQVQAFSVQLFLFTMLSVISALNMACLALDGILFPGFLDEKLLPPVFIVGNARSGTTNFHRLMSSVDEEQFLPLKMWEIMFHYNKQANVPE